MKRQLGRIAAYGAVAAAAVWAVMQSAQPSRPAMSQEEYETAPAWVSAAAIPGQPQTELVLEELRSAPWGPDPFEAAAVEEGSGAAPIRVGGHDWVLSGIVYSDKSPMAIINDKPSREGDTIDDARVVDISPGSVTLNYRGRRLTLTITKG